MLERSGVSLVGEHVRHIRLRVPELGDGREDAYERTRLPKLPLVLVRARLLQRRAPALAALARKRVFGGVYLPRF